MRNKRFIILILIIGFSIFNNTISKGNNLTEKKEKLNKELMAKKVKKEFLHAWNGYKKYAWGYDALKPLSKTGHNWYSNTLLMTPVDAYDVMLLMGLKKEAKEAKKLIFDKLTFDLDMKIQHFEISIRILGGLLSAYQLDGDKKFLQLAEDLGRRMIKVFDSKTGMPYRYVNLKTGEVSGTYSNAAEIGTYIIEYGVLSKLTGNPVYYEKARKAMNALFDRRSKMDLTGVEIDIETGEWKNKICHISGGIDSYYEYMLKAAILFKDNDMKNMWDKSIKAINTYLADNVNGNLWYGYSDMDSGQIKYTNYGSLDAFFAALLALGGDLERAKQLQESNYKMWMMHGIEPESMNYKTMTVGDSSYILRPENIESAYYLYSYTKEEKYLKMGKDMFESIIKYCRTDIAYAALKNVVTKEKTDYMESFFFAETLKYAYLIFADEKTLDFKNTIFGTEAHPFKNTWDK